MSREEAVKVESRLHLQKRGVHLVDDHEADRVEAQSPHVHYLLQRLRVAHHDVRGFRHRPDLLPNMMIIMMIIIYKRD